MHNTILIANRKWLASANVDYGNNIADCVAVIVGLCW